MPTTINVRSTSGDAWTIHAPDSATIAEVKVIVAAATAIPADRQRLIYSGRILPDTDSLVSIKFVGGNTMHLARKVDGGAPAPANSPVVQAGAPPQRASSASLFTANQPLAGPQGGLDAIQQRLMSDPALMQQMMTSPMTEAILSNPDMMRSFMMANPQTRQLVERHPEVARLMTDPAMLRQSMQMMRNPAVMQEAMRNQDLMLRNIESMPGGFNALASLHAELGPLTNPAAVTPDAPAHTPAAANPFTALFGSPAAGSGTGGATGSAAAGMGGVAMDSPGLHQLMGSPAFQQLVAQSLQDPAQLQHALGAFGAGLGAAPASGWATPAGAAGRGQMADSLMDVGLRFADQVQQLKAMGFYDEAENLRALTATDGNVSAAVERLLRRQNTS